MLIKSRLMMQQLIERYTSLVGRNFFEELGNAVGDGKFATLLQLRDRDCCEAFRVRTDLHNRIQRYTPRASLGLCKYFADSVAD